MEDEAMAREIDELNDEMVTAGVRVFVGGLTPPQQARFLRNSPENRTTFIEGPCLHADEHVGGFWVLACEDIDSALEWGRKAAVACRASIEVRAFN